MALEGKYDESIKYFSTAISISPFEPDAWKRRGQTRAAAGNIFGALEDYNHALSIGKEPDTYYQRAKLFQQMKNYREAVKDFLKHNELSTNRTALLYNHLGFCQSQLGDLEDATISFQKAIECDENFLDGYLNHALMFKELGN